MDKRAAIEQAAAMQAMASLISSVFWSCTRVIKGPYKTSELSPDEKTTYLNCVHKNMEFLQKSNQQQGPTI